MPDPQKQFVVYGYPDPEKAPILGTADSMAEAMFDILHDDNGGCIYEYDAQHGQLVNEHGPIWCEETEKAVRKQVKAGRSVFDEKQFAQDLGL